MSPNSGTDPVACQEYRMAHVPHLVNTSPSSCSKLYSGARRSIGMWGLAPGASLR